MTNFDKTVLYTGVTSDLPKRVFQHKAEEGDGFTSKYHATRLVYAEICDSAEVAIVREKQIKGGSRKKKIVLIEQENPHWDDLSETLFS